jgi:hypothetical protein
MQEETVIYNLYGAFSNEFSAPSVNFTTFHLLGQLLDGFLHAFPFALANGHSHPLHFQDL